MTCQQPAASTLTYVYADSMAVVGPLAVSIDPHNYDLCQMHSDRLTAPVGWEIVRVVPDPNASDPDVDDVDAWIKAVRDTAHPWPKAQ